jgi:predicted transcriptional regulator
MLDTKLTKKIVEFVKAKPRTVQEVAQLINKNWRTADRYLEKLADDGILALRTFREGTRGALKLAFWQSSDSIHGNDLQQRLVAMIESGKDKYDFSPLEIFQYVDKKYKRAFLEEQTDENVAIEHELVSHMRGAKKQVLFFSGNLSFVNVIEDDVKLLDVLEEVARRGIPIKFLARIDITAMKNLNTLLALNTKIGKDMIEVRHAVHPLRTFIVDNTFVRMKETKSPLFTREIDLKTYLFYEILDPDWVQWLQNVFWNYWRTAIPAERRLENLQMIQKLKRV